MGSTMSEAWTEPGIGLGACTPLRTSAVASDELRGSRVRERDDAEFDAFVRREIPFWAEVVRTAGASVE